MTPELIESSSQMDELLKQLNDVTLIAVDTEFFRETTYYPQLALVQIATDSIVACIDPLAFDAKPALKNILLDDNITKIFHSCSQDLEVLFYYLGETPGAIYDTQIANALLTKHHQVGYASLVENELGTALDKSQTRTNWLQRPLTQKQIQYAGDDVLYLYQLQNVLDEKLQQLGRKTWFDEESSKLVDTENNYQVAEENLWRRVKGATRLNRNKLAIVQSIAKWREHLAQQKDRTRRKILADDIVVDLAFSAPDNVQTIDQVIGNKYSFKQQEIQQLLEAIEAAIQTPTEQCPDNRFDILNGEQKVTLKALQQAVNDKAEELGISAAILSSKKELERLILSHDQADTAQSSELNIMQGWRQRCIGQQLLEKLSK
ncbi:MAG: ribonuclease D [Gammaproteobacteria bacterium]|nr:ribonuclease D [Gammaproteobacteria bacterium]